MERALFRGFCVNANVNDDNDAIVDGALAKMVGDDDVVNAILFHFEKCY